eukprot:TRINITY_DN22583_c0_g1_i2.p1 TRINITY_DN22583_c0_g1~~TRINITY_DN22583_c0_g1_i2.p1  ORF type:complete len:896 (-),score=130.62 TRINITY_DN22583_c0_g1_i2:43-2595(-)
MLYLFLGVNVAADKFVVSIESITSSKRRVQQKSTGHMVTVKVWNGTVANLTLMALGSSAPEILLSVIEIVGNGFFSGELGPSTIVGSASFNLFVIVGICVLAIPSGETRRIKEIGVYHVTAAFSIFAYLWLVFIVQVHSTDVIDTWEALLTLAFLPVLIAVSYLTDIGWWSGSRKQPLVERPVSLCSDGEVPLASSSWRHPQSTAVGRPVWRHDLSRSPSREYPELPLSESSVEPDWPGFKDPGVVADKYGRPYQNDAGILTFPDDALEVSSGLEGKMISVPIFRKNGATGTVSCKYRTEGRSAVPSYDFVESQGELVFQSGEITQQISLELLPKKLSEAADQFQVILEEAVGGAIFNPNLDGGEERSILTLTIHNENNDLTRTNAAIQMSQYVDKVINVDKLRLGTSSWYEAIASALCDVTEEEDARATCADWLWHLLSLPWKFSLAVLVPPPQYCAGWMCFIMSLVTIGGLTCIVIDFAELFGCVTGIQDSITAITIVALGTSMPDLFASKQAACADKYADASIVNVTGSNSVNVFLGIGLPWSIAAIYWSAAGPNDDWLKHYSDYLGAYPQGAFIVKGGNLAFSVAVFTAAAMVGLGVIHIRRTRMGGELGGPAGTKVISGMFLISLWVFYIVVTETTDVVQQVFAMFIGVCVLENVLLVTCLILYLKGGISLPGRSEEDAKHDEEGQQFLFGKTSAELRTAGDRSSFELAPLPPTGTLLATREDMFRGRLAEPALYGRSKIPEISFTGAAFVCLAAKKLKRFVRPPMPPPNYPPPSEMSIQRCPSFYSVDTLASDDSRREEHRPTSLTGRVAGLIGGHAADWAALTVAGLAAGTLANPNGPSFLGP